MIATDTILEIQDNIRIKEEEILWSCNSVSDALDGGDLATIGAGATVLAKRIDQKIELEDRLGLIKEVLSEIGEE